MNRNRPRPAPDRSRRLWLLTTRDEPRPVSYLCMKPGCAQIATTSGLQGPHFMLLCPEHALSDEEREFVVSGLTRGWKGDLGVRE